MYKQHLLVHIMTEPNFYVTLVLVSLLIPIASSGPSALEVERQRRLQRRDIQSSYHAKAREAAGSDLHQKLAHLSLDQRPFFHQTATQITVQEGSNAFFGCKVENVHNQTVSWIRKSDGYILYIGEIKFVDDERFELIHGGVGGDWTLRLRLAKEHDAGGFECQISTSPKISKIFRLNVVVPEVRITGAESEMHVEAGSSIALKCLVSKGLHRPKFVFWYRDKVRLVNSYTDGVTIKDNVDEIPTASEAVVENGSIDSDLSPDGDVISYWRNPDAAVQGSVTSSETTSPSADGSHSVVTSFLTITSVNAGDSGNYSCAPDNARPAKVNLHVIKDENPAAMQREVANQANQLRKSTNQIFSIFVLLCTITWWLKR